jgi:uncharacterized protein DUF6644
VASLLPFFKWCDNTLVAQAIRDSRWWFPIIEAIHLLALTVLLGVVIVLALRLFGLALKYQTVPQVVRTYSSWTWGSIAVMLVTGILLFLSEALKCYGSPSFRVKMVCLFTAIVFQATIFRMATSTEKIDFRRGQRVLLGVFTLALWFGVGLAGRAIGFIG